MSFEAFPKIPRLSRPCVVTEKLDGTNAQIYVSDSSEVLACSRTRIITPENDNYGFARWVAERSPELATVLGPGRHFGEWWGQGIQRRYGLSEKRFSLFDAQRWRYTPLPAFLHVVPVLYMGVFDTNAVDNAMDELQRNGSAAAPGFMNPEGVIVWHTASRAFFKKTFEDGTKGLRDNS